MILDYNDFVNEAASPKNESIETFAQNRLIGAMKISESAKEKGGDAMLTYHHFRVKLSYYKKAAEGKMDFEEAEEELEKKIKQLTEGFTGANIKISQVDFQKIMGEIEVLGELLIKNK
jgi:tRNA(Ile2) C34 agmatinyltransferase TiaS